MSTNATIPRRPVARRPRPERHVCDAVGMPCPGCVVSLCNFVIDTRPTAAGEIRRRRECFHCGRRWTTYERAEPGGEDIRDWLVADGGA